MKKPYLILFILIVILIILSFIYINNQSINDDQTSADQLSFQEKNNEETQTLVTKEYINCLKDSGLIIYGSKTCPACKELIDSLGGYENVEPIYIECTEDPEKCNQAMKTTFVPELQINESLYEGSRNLDSISDITNCKL